MKWIGMSFLAVAGLFAWNATHQPGAMIPDDDFWHRAALMAGILAAGIGMHLCTGQMKHR